MPLYTKYNGENKAYHSDHNRSFKCVLLLRIWIVVCYITIVFEEITYWRNNCFVTAVA